MSPPAMTAVPTNQSSSTAAAAATSATSLAQTSSANSPSSSSSTSQRTSNTNGDSLFEPSVEMMVNDFDDERTLEEEEALAAEEDPSTELSNLQRVRLNDALT